MSNKTVLITGAASGIGFGVARTLGKLGFQMVITDLTEELVSQAADKLASEGISCKAYPLDVTSEIDITRLKSQLEGTPIQILVNNAGIQHVAKLEDFPMDKFRLLLDVLLTGPARLTQAFLPAMRESGFGRIINIGSLHSLVASPYKSAYVAAKHGLLGFSKVLALETADQDITINTICPAYVKTPLVEKQIADQARTHGISEEEVINRIMLEPMPKKAFIDIEEIAHTVQFLADEKARNMTGQALVLDGGWTVR